MKINCPRCKSKLEVDAIGDFVACFHCSLEFTVDEPTVDEPTVDEPTVDEMVVLPDEPKKRKSIWFFLTNFRWSKINWVKLAVGSLAIFLGISFFVGIAMTVYFKSKNLQFSEIGALLVSGVGGIIFALVGFAFLCLLVLNIILWIFLPLMVYSIKQSLEEAVREIKKLNNI